MSKEVAARRDLRNSLSNVVKPTIFVPGSMPRRTDAASTPFILDSCERIIYGVVAQLNSSWESKPLCPNLHKHVDATPTKNRLTSRILMW
jgi:hypothetical protein